jgi:hypothetical protein
VTSLARAVRGIECLLAPADALRARGLRLGAPLLRPLFGDRELRVGVYGAVTVLSALLLATVAPVWLLAMGPLVLGVPHLVADLRYLVVRQGLSHRPGFWLVVVPCLALAVGFPRGAFGCGAVAAAAMCARGPVALRCAVAVCCAAFAWGSHVLGAPAGALIAHAHNLVAIVVWCVWSRGALRSTRPLLVLFALAAGGVLSGATERVVDPRYAYASELLGLDLGEFVRVLSPVADPVWALRLTVFFALAQSIHYGIWLRLIPEQDRARRGMRSFTESYRALVRELGPGSLLVAALATLALWAWGALEPAHARASYFRLALFHGPLEVAALAWVLLERGAPLRARKP